MPETRVERPRYAIATGYCPFRFNTPLTITPEDAFKVAGNLNNEGLGPVGIELYPTQKVFPFEGLEASRVKEWETRYGAKTARVHLEFAWDEAEHRFQTSVANNQHEGSRLKAGLHWFLYRSIKDAQAGFGLKLARELGAGYNVHVNAALGFLHMGDKKRLVDGFDGVDRLVENTINYNVRVVHPYMKGAILYDPEFIVESWLFSRSTPFNGILLGRDHLLDYSHKQGLNSNDLVQKEEVQKMLKAVHIAGPNHSVMDVGDPDLEKFVTLVSQGKEVVQPVQYVFDFSPPAILRYRRFEDRLRMFRERIQWLDRLQSKT